MPNIFAFVPIARCHRAMGRGLQLARAIACGASVCS
jgi:hypothetical protein